MFSRSKPQRHNWTVTNWLDKVEPCEKKCMAREMRKPRFTKDILFDRG